MVSKKRGKRTPKGPTWASPLVVTDARGRKRQSRAQPAAKDLQPGRTLSGGKWDRKGRPQKAH